MRSFNRKRNTRVNASILYLTSWKEEELPDTIRRSWKGYSFEALNQLLDQDYLRGSFKSKSVYITEAGIEQAKQLMEKYLGVPQGEIK